MDDCECGVRKFWLSFVRCLWTRIHFWSRNQAQMVLRQETYRSNQTSNAVGWYFTHRRRLNSGFMANNNRGVWHLYKSRTPCQQINSKSTHTNHKSSGKLKNLLYFLVFFRKLNRKSQHQCTTSVFSPWCSQYYCKVKLFDTNDWQPASLTAELLASRLSRPLISFLIENQIRFQIRNHLQINSKSKKISNYVRSSLWSLQGVGPLDNYGYQELLLVISNFADISIDFYPKEAMEFTATATAFSRGTPTCNCS